jgi:hypothetical protein
MQTPPGWGRCFAFLWAGQVWRFRSLQDHEASGSTPGPPTKTRPQDHLLYAITSAIRQRLRPLFVAVPANAAKLGTHDHLVRALWRDRAHYEAEQLK